MSKFLQTLIALFFALCSMSCKKGQEQVGSEAPPWFLFSKQMVFSGTVADSTVFWRFGVFEFQRGSGILNAGSTSPLHKYLKFWLTSNADLTTRFEINTPAFDATYNRLFSDVLFPGSKAFGKESKGFEMKLTLKNQTYTTVGDQTGSLLEILKVERTKDEGNRDMALVWLKTNCKFYRSDNSFAFSLKESYILAGFVYAL